MTDKDPYRYFRVEARELLDEMSNAVLSLEKEADVAGTVSRLLRLAHTLKGAARVVRQTGIADQAHAIEDALAPWRETTGGLPGEALSGLLQRIDEMEGMLGELGVAVQAALDAGQGATAARGAGTASAAHPSPDTAPSLPTPKATDEALRNVRADAEELGSLLSGITGSHMQIASLRRHLDAATQATELADLLLGHLAKRRHRRTGTHPEAASDTLVAHDIAEELKDKLSRLDAGLSRTTDQLDRELRQTRETAEQLKLVPARQLFTTLARTVRDVAQAQGKQAVFHGEGGDVRLDGEVLAALQPALVQMARNAVAHGIETAEQRRAAGKSPEGRVTLKVLRQGKDVCFACVDDGAGIDTDAVTQAARRQGILDVKETLDEAALVRLLVRGGVSTAPVVSEVSGRGIGLNVVGDALRRLGGDLRLHTTRGQGTTWRMTVPLMMASIEVLGVEASGARASIPLEAVRHALRIPADALSRDSDGETLIHQGQAIPFAPLDLVLNRDARADARTTWSALVIEGHDGMAAIGVDRIQGLSQIVMLPLPELTPTDNLVAGATLDVEGQPQIVLDPHHLVRKVRSARRLPAGKASPLAPLLVIDDSLTTRMLEQSILASAGYEVHTATSAEEGLEMVRQRAYALILVDVDMPGMNGFEFVRTIRADADLHHIPAILVTSRSSAEDHRLGREVGADHHIVKGEFAQGAFLDTVRRLIEERGTHSARSMEDVSPARAGG